MRNIIAVLTLSLASAAIADELWVVGVDDDDSSVHTLSQVSVDAIPDEYATKGPISTRSAIALYAP